MKTKTWLSSTVTAAALAVVLSLCLASPTEAGDSGKSTILPGADWECILRYYSTCWDICSGDSECADSCTDGYAAGNCEGGSGSGSDSGSGQSTNSLGDDDSEESFFGWLSGR
jgi:hypothetical protein